jgi:hypothetical protein
MSQAFIICPETEQHAYVYVGLNFEWLQIESLGIDEQTIDCPKCGGQHQWTKEDIILRADGGG